MEIEIIEQSTNKVIAQYEIMLGSLNSSVTEEEYFSEAWRCAVEDKAVEDNERHKYSFRFSE